MERLTKRITENQIELSAKVNPTQYVNSPQRVYMKHPFWNVFDKLAEYEDLEEQGFILKAPCRIDDIVYVKTRYSVVRPYEIVECRVSKIAALSSGKGASITCAGRYANGSPYNGNFRISSFGKKVFTNKDEAEKHLND